MSFLFSTPPGTRERHRRAGFTQTGWREPLGTFTPTLLMATPSPTFVRGAITRRKILALSPRP